MCTKSLKFKEVKWTVEKNNLPSLKLAYKLGGELEDTSTYLTDTVLRCYVPLKGKAK